MPPRVTVVIPNWNGERFLKGCLSSLRKQAFEDLETIFVDNGSYDGSIEIVDRNFPEVRVVRLKENQGFAAAVNAGIVASSAEYVALLNNDTEADANWLEALVEAAELHPEAALFASKLVDFHDRGLLDGAGDALRKSGLPYRIGHGELDRGSSTRRRSYSGRVRQKPSTGARSSQRPGCLMRISSPIARTVT